ncbi:hypothetical protein M5K25_025574 [Dendrobium thyrsiflorum]|uniref:Uncharacterized protein n=1 Tax=Dendrobium thyrsiflorum TaxID=117978 RepID=A0ABD0U4G3_DENTH
MPVASFLNSRSVSFRLNSETQSRTPTPATCFLLSLSSSNVVFQANLHQVESCEVVILFLHLFPT